MWIPEEDFVDMGQLFTFIYGIREEIRSWEQYDEILQKEGMLMVFLRSFGYKINDCKLQMFVQYKD